MANIEEIIADAREEERLAREQKDKVNKALELPKIDDRRVNIPLSEYVYLRQADRDLDRLQNAIANNLVINYTGKDLTTSSDDELVRVYRYLYPYEYEQIYKEKYAEYKAQEEAKAKAKAKAKAMEEDEDE